MNYGKIIYLDTANGPGLRTTLFVSGCRHHCPGCFNEATWDFGYGQPFTEETRSQLLSSLDNSVVQGITFLGGEPMEPENQPCILDILQGVRTHCPKKDVWLYSGYTWEELTGQKPSRACTDQTEDILSLIHVLVDGPFRVKQKDIIGSPFRGSTNQRIIDVPRSLGRKYPVLTSYMDAT